MLVGEDQPIGTRNRERVQVVHKVLAKIAAGNETTLMPARNFGGPSCKPAGTPTNCRCTRTVRFSLRCGPRRFDARPPGKLEGTVSAPSRQRQIGSVNAFAFDMASSQRASSQAVDVDHFVACVIN
jgi:hypothetical protein